jgi:hypothetical protein
MSKKYDIKEVIQAVEILLSSENQKSLEIVNNKRKTDSNINLDEPLKLINEISQDTIPKDTESIISQAEKYLKK